MNTHKTSIETGNEIWDSFVPTIKWFLEHDKSNFVIDGKHVSGYRSPDTPPIWLRDHTHQMKGFKYFDPDMTSALDIFRQYQMADGEFYDFFVHSEQPCEPSNDKKPGAMDRFEFDAKNEVQFARCGVEADVEYLAAEAVHQAWQATGDDEWMIAMLDTLERGLTYTLTNPTRWSSEHGLVKRPFTIDTWDFEYGKFTEIDGRRVHESILRGDNYWCIMHGDNTGMAKSCRLLARMYDHAGNRDQAEKWRRQGDYFMRRTNELCWNGKFYTHHVHITPVEVEADEPAQLSLSNAYSLNRGVMNQAQCASVIREYMRRREANKDKHIAEWYSIDPSFPNFAFGYDFPPGVYVNGGIMPLVGGELARGAFENGFEDYGVDILRRYHSLAIEPKETYLWYRPDGSHWDAGCFLATDGWGSAAMLYALIEGLAGIEDESKLFETVRVSPRWAAANESNVRVCTAYETSGAYFVYEYSVSDSDVTIATEGSGKKCRFHVLMPRDKKTESVRANGRNVEFTVSRIIDSTYIDFQAEVGAKVEIIFL